MVRTRRESQREKLTCYEDHTGGGGRAWLQTASSKHKHLADQNKLQLNLLLGTEMSPQWPIHLGDTC